MSPRRRWGFVAGRKRGAARRGGRSGRNLHDYLLQNRRSAGQAGVEGAEMDVALRHSARPQINEACGRGGKMGDIALSHSDHPLRLDRFGANFWAGTRLRLTRSANGCRGGNAGSRFCSTRWSRKGRGGALRVCQSHGQSIPPRLRMAEKGRIVVGGTLTFVVFGTQRGKGHLWGQRSGRTMWADNPWKGNQVTGWPEEVDLAGKHNCSGQKHMWGTWEVAMAASVRGTAARLDIPSAEICLFASKRALMINKALPLRSNLEITFLYYCDSAASDALLHEVIGSWTAPKLIKGGPNLPRYGGLAFWSGG